MCNKPFDSIICNFAFFLTACAGLAATSGTALCLGGIIMSKEDPGNAEYSVYAGKSGFFIGIKSAAYFQWLTAGFATLFAKMNATNTDRNLGERILTVYFENFLLLVVYSVLHYFSLSISVQGEFNCMDFRTRLMGSGAENSNPFCDSDRSWSSLFKTFFVGTSICFTGCLLLQTIYLCIQAACETEVTPNTEPTAEVPVVVMESIPAVTIVEVMAMPAATELTLQPR